MNTPVPMSRAYVLVLLSSLYLAQGLPFGFFTQALPVLMRERGLSLTAIGASGILFLPWALKFLWAPLVDTTGTRRRWIVSLQLITVIGAAVLATVDFDREFRLIFVALIFFNVLAATQDIATDGLAVRLLGPADRGLGNGIQVGAYRFGMILGGGALLWIFARSGWETMFLSLSALLLLSSIPAFFARDAGFGEHATPARHPAAREVMLGWIARLKVRGLLALIGLVSAFKFGESAAAALVGPFMHDAGMSKETIAIVKGTIGSVMGLAGAALGGALAFRLGRRRALILCGVLQTLGILAYIACALHPRTHALLYFASTLEHGFGSMATVALFTLMMDASDPKHAGTDYTLLACAVVIASGAAGICAGVLGDALGYAAAFGTAAALSSAGCALLVVGVDRGAGPQRLETVWRRP